MGTFTSARGAFINRKYVKQIGRFDAVDGTGNEYLIVEYQEFIKTGDLDGTMEIAGLRYLETDDGKAVNWIAKGKY